MVPDKIYKFLIKEPSYYYRNTDAIKIKINKAHNCIFNKHPTYYRNI